MAQVGSIGARKLVQRLADTSGLPASVAAVAQAAHENLPPIGTTQIVPQNVAADLIERSNLTRYPAVHVYCERLSNTLREKFRTFSGKAHLTMEVRSSQDRLEGLERQLQLFVDAVTRVLDSNRGDWSDGFFYGGGYEVTFGPVKRGGKSFLQTAKIGIEVDVSIQ
jgi:hypothetical protein